MLKASFVTVLAGSALFAGAHPGNGIVALSATSVLTGDALHNGIWRFEAGVKPKKLVDRFHCHWVTKGLDGRLYAETLHESGGAWRSSVHRLKPDGRYDRAVTSSVDALHGVFLVDKEGSLVHQEKGVLVTDRGGRTSLFRGSGSPEGKLGALGQVRALAWGPDGDLYASDGARILKAGRDGVLRLHAQIGGTVSDKLYADDRGRPNVWSLTVGSDGSLYAAVPSIGRVVRIARDGRQTVVSKSEGGWATTGVACHGKTVFLLESRTVGNSNEGPRVRSVGAGGTVTLVGTVAE
ncbi:MAG: hypothetical protein JST30_01970 [Armatimonadetes bacterium]|nr:hypothetical protein [Armatimonadota bacterium]